jgi:AraC-like DNA-binding protein
MQELYERTIMRFEYVSFSGSPVREDMRCRELPGLGLADITSLGVSTRRTPRHVVNDDLGLCITLSGQRLMRQRGREGLTEAGDALLLDGGEPSESSMSASRLFNLRLPRKAIAGSVKDLDDKVARPIRRDCQALKLLTGFADVLQSAPALATPETQRLTVKHVYDLVALALGATRERAEAAEQGGMRAARQQAILAEISANFARPEFSAQDIALKLGLSPRYLQELLHESGTTFTERVLGLRLQKARAALAQGSGRSVAAIALEAGFSDISYFNRCFRRRFGDTPSGVRGQARRKH